MLRKEGKGGVDVELGMEPWSWAAIYRRVGSDQVMDDFSSKKNKIIVLVQQLEHGLTSEKKDDITLHKPGFVSNCKWSFWNRLSSFWLLLIPSSVDPIVKPTFNNIIFVFRVHTL